MKVQKQVIRGNEKTKFGVPAFEVEKVYIIKDLASARAFLISNPEPIILTNAKGSTRYYGMVVLDYMFETLIKQFPQIVKVVVNVEDDNAAFYTALKLGYRVN